MSEEKRFHWFWFFVVLILLGVLIFFFGARLYLYVQFLLGNDILIRLTSDTDSLSLSRGETADITATVRVTANPFCTVQCSMEYLDLSRGTRNASQLEKVTLGSPFSQTYTVIQSRQGFGQDLIAVSVACLSVPSKLCDTSGEPTERRVLIPVNYEPLQEDQQQFKNISRSYEQAFETIEYRKMFYENTSNYLDVLNVYTSESSIKNKKDAITQSFKMSENLLKNASIHIAQYRLSEATENMIKLNGIILSQEAQLQLLESDMFFGLESYISLQTKMRNNSNILFSISKNNISEVNFGEYLSTIQLWNAQKEILTNNQSLSEKKKIVSQISDAVRSISEKIVSENAICCTRNSTINPFTELKFLNKTYTPQPFKKIEVQYQCCYQDSCFSCCTDESCRATPIIFLHGHDFSSVIPADYSIDVFSDLSTTLEKESYIDGGFISVTINQTRNLGYYPNAVFFKASYYYDLFQGEAGYAPIQAKTEGIDTYAIRLKDIVDSVTASTNTSKVIIIAHSMGGLVARNYLTIYGTDHVETLIMIATPNNGITGRVGSYCSTFGEDQECQDMQTGSLFLNRLNRAPLPKIPIYNFVGSGCELEGGNGDGVVLVKNAELTGVTNIYVNGSCGTVRTLHTDILDSTQYPAVSQKIANILKGNTTQ